jgi:citrate lyase gamma subunit
VESGDIQISVEPIGGGKVEIELSSTVLGLYGKQIRKGHRGDR